MRRLALAVAAAALAGGGPAAAGATDGGPHVSIGYAAYTPHTVSVLTGATVSWTNDSVRAHTVTADDGGYDSGALRGGEGYSHAYAAPGVYGYYCRLHAGITGTVEVHDALLDPIAGPAASGRPYPLRGRAASGVRTVTLQADTGGGFADAGTATVGDDGAFTLTVTPAGTTTYRVVTGADASPPVTVAVLDRTVAVHVARHGALWAVTATVTPASPGAHMVLQQKLRERFGWWPQRTARLDRRSRATWRLRRPPRAPTRVLLTLADDATPLAVSRTFALGG